MEEQWKSVEGLEKYQISNLGRAKSLNYRNTGKEQMLKLSLNDKGYYRVGFNIDGKVKTKMIHTLVWDAFGDKPRNGHILEVDHINNNKTDNRIENLQLLSTRENCSKKVYESKTSKYKGVVWDKRKNKWQSQIIINGKNIYLGLFESEDLAGDAYQYALTHQDNPLIKPKKTNTSKFPGVYWYKKLSKWKAQLQIDGKNKHLGYFTSELKAAEAYQKALKQIQ